MIHTRTSFFRFLLSSFLRYLLPILLHRPGDWGLRVKNYLARRHGGFLLPRRLRDRALRLDGYFPARHFPGQAGHEHNRLLVYDAGERLASVKVSALSRPHLSIDSLAEG